MRKVSVLLVVALVAAACSSGTTTSTGSSDGGGGFRDPLDVVRGSVAAARAAKTATVEMNLYLEYEDSNLLLPGKGELDLAKGVGEFTFDLGALYESFVDVPAGVPTKMQMAFTNTVMYMRVPGAVTSLPGGKQWIEIDMTEFAKAGARNETPYGIGSSDPDGMFDILTGVTVARQRGTEQIRGIDTTRYEVVIDARKAVRAVPPAQRAAMRQEMEVWISGDGLVRKQTVEVPSDLGKSIMDIFYSGYGEPVIVDLPPRSKTYKLRDASEIGRIFGGG